MHTVYRIDPNIKIVKPDDMVREPVIVRVTEFDNEGVEDFNEQFTNALSSDQPVIPIVVDSFGGSCYGCLSMLNSIQNSPKPVATIVTAKAMSAGAILFAFGTNGYRYMAPDAHLMLHDVSSIAFGKIEDLKVDVGHTEDLNRIVYRRMAAHLGKPADYFLDLLREHKHLDLFMNGKVAKKHGIANHLRLPNFELHMSVSYVFDGKKLPERKA